MSKFTDFNKLKELKAQVRQVQRMRKSGKTQREKFLDDTLPKLLAPNPDNDDLLYIGGHWIPVNQMEDHCLTQGISGGGKTLQLKPQIASALRSIRRGTDRRAIIADAKQDMLPMVAELTQKQGIPLLYFNVSDRRSVAYDIARDIEGRSDKCGEAARQLIPTPRKGEPFWTQAAQALLQAGMLRLNQTNGQNWGLHHVYGMAMMALPELVEFLSVHPSGRQVAAKYLPDDMGGNTQFGFTSQLDVSLRQLEVAAAAQYYTDRKRWISSNDFLTSESVLLIGTNTDTRQTTNPIVRLLFQNLANRIMDLPNSDTRRIFAFLDELPLWGVLPKLDELLYFSRSKGMIISLVIQDIEQLNDLYGRSIATVIGGNCSTKLLFKPASYESAQWAIRTLGEHIFKRYEYTKQFTYEGITESQSMRTEKDFPLTTGELMGLGKASKRVGSKFVLQAPFHKPVIKFMTPQEISAVQPKDARIPLKVPREPHQYNMPANFNPNQIMGNMRETFSNQQLKEQYLSNYADNPIQQAIARQVFEMYEDMAHSVVDDFRDFHVKQSRGQ
ncbi:MAG: type IV secretion system DNA-binding domain-containing protein [Cyanobacteria bacterium P01_A01_bin.40]